MKEQQDMPVNFRSLELAEPLLQALEEVGYETPTPIQAKTIPLLLDGHDVLGQAQTGTGKTAAFALPILSNIHLSKVEPQALVLAPTRELAIQVAEAFHTYAVHLKGFNVLPIYGGQDYGGQLRMLKRGVHVVVGTPGRVMDHMRRGSLNLDSLECLVLDEADEMLRMGFIDDVEWILEQTPAERQVALFSATMPLPIRRIAQKYLKDPEQITIESKTTTVETIRQRYWIVSGHHKLDALTRILEAEPFDGILIFVRTKTETVELAEKLQARGYSAQALNGDMVQNQRERTIEQLKEGTLNIVVATDVAARGLDVDRISHVINYDIPSDTESYVHRIGRTGRAGRSGEAILFVSPREKNMLYAIEKATRKRIELMELPSTEIINDKRIARFKQRITDTLAAEDLDFYNRLVEQYCHEHDVPAIDAAAALAKLLQGDSPLLFSSKPEKEVSKRQPERERESYDSGRGASTGAPGKKRRSESLYGDEKMVCYRIEVGKVHDVKPGNIAGAIINEIGLDPEAVGKIIINDQYSTVELPSDMPDDVFHELRKVRVCGRQLRLSKMDDHAHAPNPYQDRKKPFGRPGGGKPGKPGMSGKPKKSLPFFTGSSGAKKKRMGG